MRSSSRTKPEPTFVYVAGSIPKESEQSGEFSWSKAELAELEHVLAPLSPVLLNPSTRSDDLADPHAAFGRDMLQVKLSAAIVVDARAKRGLGVGAELMFAKTLGIPVVSIAPLDTHYRRTDLTFLGQHLDVWTHPFVAALSDFIANDVSEGAEWLLERLTRPETNERREVVDEAIQHYVSTQLSRDDEMCGLLANAYDVAGVGGQRIAEVGRAAA